MPKCQENVLHLVGDMDDESIGPILLCSGFFANVYIKPQALFLRCMPGYGPRRASQPS